VGGVFAGNARKILPTNQDHWEDLMGRRNILLPSTRAFLREARRIKNFSLFGFFHSYFYGRLKFKP
jgi:hypothetical protein